MATEAHALSAEELEERVDALYRTAREGFVSERNALAKSLAASGARAEAQRVRSLRKPVLSAWAVNRLVHEESVLFRKLLAAGESLRAAQRDGDRSRLAAATVSRRAAIAGLRESAERILEEAGGTAARGTLNRIERTLEALAFHGEAGPPEARAGRLTEDLEPPGMESLLTLGIESAPAQPRTGSPKSESPEPERSPPPESTGQRRSARATARAERPEAARRRRNLEAQLARLETELRGAEERAAKIEERAAARRQERERAAERVAAARRTLDESEAALKEIDEDLEAIRREGRRADLERTRLQKKADAVAKQL